MGHSTILYNTYQAEIDLSKELPVHTHKGEVGEELACKLKNNCLEQENLGDLKGQQINHELFNGIMQRFDLKTISY